MVTSLIFLVANIQFSVALSQAGHNFRSCDKVL